PLRLAERELVSSGHRGEVLVLPRIEPVLPVEGGGAPGSENRGREGGDSGPLARAGAPELELDILRPYRQGSPATRIHWPTLARLGPSASTPRGRSLRQANGPIVWVTASHEIPVLSVRKGAGWIVAPHPLAAGAAVEFRVAGCIGQRLAAVWKEAA